MSRTTSAFQDVPLFDPEPYRVAAPAATTAGQRRALRVAALVAAGQHPLSGRTRGQIPLHPWAAPIQDRTAPGLRCGTCAHRVLLDGGYRRRFPKCVLGDGARATHYTGSDIRRYWPACRDYSARKRDS